MKPVIRFGLLGSVLLLAALRADAAMIYDIKLYNGSGQSVELVEKTRGRKLAVIPAGGSKTFAYGGGVFLRVSGRQISYLRADPPPEYISAGLFSVSFKAQLAPNLRIYLLSPTTIPTLLLPPQPNGFPLLPSKP
jgi:hypothetical protein